MGSGLIGGGGSGTAGAPTDATYVTQTPNATLTAEQALSLLGTGLMLNTTGTGVVSIYGGASCSAKFPRSADASGAWTCEEVALGTDTSGNYAGSASEGGPATTALALNANPSDCSANQFANAIAANGNLTCSAIADADVPNTITINLATAATALASDPSDCSANQFANAIAASGDLSCSAIADADVPNTITIALAATATALASNPTDCSSNQFANAIAASGNLTCSAIADADVPDTITLSNLTQITTRDHGSLTGLTDDDHTQYTLLAGRTGTTNDTTLSSSAGGTLYGSTTTANDLTLRANSANTTTGEINVNGFVDIYPSIGAQTTGTPTAMKFAPALDLTGIATSLRYIGLGGTIDVGHGMWNLGSVAGVYANATIDFDDASNEALGFVQLFWNDTTIATSVASTPPSGFTVFDQQSWTTSGGVTSTTNSTIPQHQSVRSLPEFIASGASSNQTITASTGLYYQPQITTNNATATSTVTTTRGVWVDDAAKSGTGTETLTTQVGVDIAALTAGATNIGIRNADTTAFTSGATQTMSAASSTISVTATFIELDNSTGGSLTLTGTPIIAAGQDGEMIHLINVDSADTIVLTNGTANNIRGNGGTNITLSAGDGVTLIYSAALGDWVAMLG